MDRAKDCAWGHLSVTNFLQQAHLLKFLALLKSLPPAKDQALRTGETLHTENLTGTICLAVFLEDPGALLGRLPSLKA